MIPPQSSSSQVSPLLLRTNEPSALSAGTLCLCGESEPVFPSSPPCWTPSGPACRSSASDTNTPRSSVEDRVLWWFSSRSWSRSMCTSEPCPWPSTHMKVRGCSNAPTSPTAQLIYSIGCSDLTFSWTYCTPFYFKWNTYGYKTMNEINTTMNVWMCQWIVKLAHDCTATSK